MLKQFLALTKCQRKKILDLLNKKLEEGADKKTEEMRDLLMKCIDERDGE